VPVQFVQLIEFQTPCIDDVMAVLRRVHQDAVTDRPELKAEIRKDRDRHDRYVLVLSLPERPDILEANAAAVERLSAQLGPYIDGQVVLRNLDLIDGDSYAFGEQMAVRTSRVR
jgi:hypothetical protein